jgi:hypothetical protein
VAFGYLSKIDDRLAGTRLTPKGRKVLLARLDRLVVFIKLAG